MRDVCGVARLLTSRRVGLLLLPLALLIGGWELDRAHLAEEETGTVAAQEPAVQPDACADGDASRIITIIDEHERTIDVGDIFSDRKLVWEGGRAFRSFEREMPICIIVRDSTDIVVDVEDIFGDNVVVWARGGADVSNLIRKRGTQQVADPPGARANFDLWMPLVVQDSPNRNAQQIGGPPAGGPDFSLRMPVVIQVEESARVVVDVEDIFGDNVIAWAEGDLLLSNLGAEPAGPRPPKNVGRGGAAFTVEMPLSIRVASSTDVAVNVEDVFGDVIAGWSGGEALLSNLAQGIPAEAGGTGFGLAHVDVQVPVDVDVSNSDLVVVDLEDVLSDAVFGWAEGDLEASNLVGAAAPSAAAGPGTGEARFAAPISIRTDNSRDVLVGIEDVLGDNVLSRSGSGATLSNLVVPAAGALPAGAGMTIETGLSIEIGGGSERIGIDIEDIAGDVVLAQAGGATLVSNLESAQNDGGLPGGPGAVRLEVPVAIDIRDGSEVAINVEDVVGDTDIAGTRGDLCVSNLQDPSRGEAPIPGAAGIVARVPVTVRISRSHDVAIDIEDLYGDNEMVLDGAIQPPIAVVEVPVDLTVVESSDVDVQIAEVTANNRFALSRNLKEPLVLEEPGRYEVAGGVIVLRSSAERQVTDSSSVELVVAQFFADNILAGVDLAPCPEATATPPAYLGAQPGEDAAFRIVVAAGPRLAANPEALAAIERAADRWEVAIEDPVEVTIAVSFSDWMPQGITAQARTPQFAIDYQPARAALVADAGDELAQAGGFDDALAAALPEQFEAVIPPGVTVTEQMALTAANAKAVGFEDPNRDMADASIRLNAQVLFDYDRSDGVDAGHLDLESVALHEMGHVLGFISAVDDINRGRTQISPTPLDLYRFDVATAGRPATMDGWTTRSRNLFPGAEATLWFMDQRYPMATGEETGYFPNVDGQQARHWQGPAAQAQAVGAMSAQLEPEQVLSVSCADLRALDLIGYDIAGCRE